MATAKTIDDGGGTEPRTAGAEPEIIFVDYEDESRLGDVDRLVSCDLSEPYSIFTYRYFLNRFPDLCILAVSGASGEVCGCVVGKIDVEEVPLPPPPAGEAGTGAPSATDAAVDAARATGGTATGTSATAQPADTGGGGGDQPGTAAAAARIQTGYIGMLAVSKSHRRKGIGKDLVRRVLRRMRDRGCESVTLETVSAVVLLSWRMGIGLFACLCVVGGFPPGMHGGREDTTDGGNPPTGKPRFTSSRGQSALLRHGK